MKLLKFYANWCQPCKRQSEILKDFDIIPVESINIEEESNQDLVEKYNIRNLPTLILVEDDIILHRFAGFTSLDSICEKIKELKIK